MRPTGARLNIRACHLRPCSLGLADDAAEATLVCAAPALDSLHIHAAVSEKRRRKNFTPVIRIFGGGERRRGKGWRHCGRSAEQGGKARFHGLAA